VRLIIQFLHLASRRRGVIMLWLALLSPVTSSIKLNALKQNNHPISATDAEII
jgi:hypothetical protein